MLGLLILTIGSTCLGDCDNCDLSETCIDEMCFSRCSDMKRTGYCDCFGDICFDKAWCRGHDEVCCRTCETNWTVLVSIIAGFVVTISLAVAYSELCMSSDGELRAESKNGPGKIRESKSSFCCTRFKVQGFDDPGSSYESPLSSVDTLYTANLANLPRKSDRIKVTHSKIDLIRKAQTWTCPALPRLSEDNEKNLDEDTLRLVRVPGLVSLVGLSKNELSALSFGKQDDGRLEVPSYSYRSKNHSDVSSPLAYQKSNWDSFFETQSSLMQTKRSENTAANNDGNFGDSTDWDKTDIELSLLDFSSNNCRKEDGKYLSGPGTADSSSAENLPLENLRQNGDVLFSYYSKRGLRFTFVSLDTQLDDIATWLNKDSKYSIPISQSVHSRRSEIERRQKSSKPTLADIFGGDLNPEKDGITCFVGPVEGTISFKMSKCDVNQLQSVTKDIKASPIGTHSTLEFVS